MGTLAQLFIGILSCLVFVSTARRAGSKREAMIYAVGLVVAASIYVGFAVAGGASPPWVAIEAAGLLIFSSLALIGLRYSVWVLMLGWAAHAVWDALLHEVPGAGFVPGWYPVACLGFDLFLAAYIVFRARGRRRPARAT